MSDSITIEDLQRAYKILSDPERLRANMEAEAKCVACWRKMVLAYHLGRDPQEIADEYRAVLAICEVFGQQARCWLWPAS